MSVLFAPGKHCTGATIMDKEEDTGATIMDNYHFGKYVLVLGHIIPIVLTLLVVRSLLGCCVCDEAFYQEPFNNDQLFAAPMMPRTRGIQFTCLTL